MHDVFRHLDPALVVLAHEGTRGYEELYDLVYRREASKPNEIWQAVGYLEIPSSAAW